MTGHLEVGSFGEVWSQPGILASWAWLSIHLNTGPDVGWEVSGPVPVTVGRDMRPGMERQVVRLSGLLCLLLKLCVPWLWEGETWELFPFSEVPVAVRGLPVEVCKKET